MKRIILLSLISLMVFKLNAQEGTLDPTFGNGGSIAVSFGVLFAPNGQLVGVTSDKIYRYNTDGTPDASFGNGGFAPLSVSAANQAVAVQRDGKIVVTGTLDVPNPPGPFFLYFQAFSRYNSDGTPDPSFGNKGVALVQRGFTNERLPQLEGMFLSNENEIFYTVLIASPGGRSYEIRRLSAFPAPVFVGSLTLFNSASSYRRPAAIGFQNDGKILVGGYELGFIQGTTQTAQRGLLVRYNNDGTLDESFGTKGIVALNIGSAIINLTIQTDGKILGTALNTLYRFNPDGTLDASFGDNGAVNTGFTIGKVQLQNNGKIIVAGSSGSNLFFKRLNVDGSTDPTFGSGGTSMSNLVGTLFDMTIAGNRLYVYGTGTGILAAYQLNNVVCTPPTFVNNNLIILDATCANNDGNINIIPTSGTAPFMYSINGGTTYVKGPDVGYGFQNLPSGTYKLRLKDANGCESAIVEREVKLNCTTTCTPPTFVNNGLIILDATCTNNDGNINIIPTSGTAPFMYSINGGVTYVAGPNAGYGFQNLPSGTYKLRLKDANGCESAIVERQVKLLCTTCTPPTFVNNGLIVLDASCGKSDGAINIIPTSGTAPFMYSINGGATYVAGPNAGYGFQNLPAGTYQLRLKDSRGCESAIVERTVRNYYNCAGVTVSTNTFAAPLLSNKDVIATYPNPNNGQFKLLLQNFTSPKAEVSIYDAKGTLIQKRSLNLTQNTIADFHLKGKAAGLYLIKVVTANGTKDIKVVVQ
jgi:uncharacterized delta-60 repeat protein